MGGDPSLQELRRQGILARTRKGRESPRREGNLVGVAGVRYGYWLCGARRDCRPEAEKKTGTCDPWFALRGLKGNHETMTGVVTKSMLSYKGQSHIWELYDVCK